MLLARGGAVVGLAILVACGSEPPAGKPFSVRQLASPAAPGSAQTRFSRQPDSPLVMSWLEPQNGAHTLRFSVFDDGSWGPARMVSQGDNWFVNWADLPSVVPIEGDRWIAHWLVLKPDQPYAYDIAYAVSADAGATWSETRILNADETIAEHGFLSFFAWDGDIGAVWLDGRIIGAMTIDEIFESEVAVGMSLRYARLRSDGTVVERGLIDELVCDCCQIDVGIAPDGPLMVYRDRSQEEMRDIMVRIHNGTSWSEPLHLGPDNWFIDGCPVNGPSVAVTGSEVAVAWFTAPDNLASVRFARSNDGGRSFSVPVELDGSGSFGHTDVVMLDDSAAMVSWWRRSEAGGMDLVARRVEADGTSGDMRVIVHSESNAPIDVPQMQLADGELVFAWTEFGDAAGIYSAAAPVW